jgi:site-specific DNA recombinase
MQHHGWSLLPEHDESDDGIRGARLDRPALDRWRDAARCGECDAGVIVSPDRLARHDAHPWLLIEEFEKLHTPLLFLQPPFGHRPQGTLLTQMQGRIAEDARVQIAERTRRGRLEKARHGECMPWAYTGYGYRSLPKRHGCAPQVLIEPSEAEVVRALYRALVEAQLRCRQIPKRLNAANTPTPTGHNTVWPHATVRHILAHRP